MTRQGTLAYYLAAWVIGCFIVSLLVWVIAVASGQPPRAAMLLEMYFFALVFGARRRSPVRVLAAAHHALVGNACPVALAAGRRGRGIRANHAAGRSQYRVDQLERSRDRADTYFP